MLRAGDVERQIKRKGTKARAKASAWYFKTGPGEYGQGDVFLGLTVPQQRAIAKEFRNLAHAEVAKLLASKYHECRFVALEILVFQFEKASGREQAKIANFYLAHTKGINNWDLVDTSAPYILGPYLFENTGKRKLLNKLVRSKNIWQRRIAIISTLYFIGQNRFDESLALAESLLADKHDLIHKATGWALREVGKRDQDALEKFLHKHIAHMPRTTLRYAIEKFPEALRKEYLTGQGRGSRFWR